MSSDDIRWSAPPSSLTLGPSEVHVWRIALDVPESTVHRMAVSLDTFEQERAERLRSKDQRRRFRVSHGQLRSILGRTLGRDPGSLRFRTEKNGKPELLDAGDLRFNLSHSQEIALCALTRGRRIGVDVEQIRPMRDAEQVAERFFCVAEEQSLASLAPAERLRAFFDAWTRKEAYIKARGETVFGWLRRFEVSLLPGQDARIVRVDDDPGEAERWSLHALTPTPRSTGALAVEGHGHELKLFRWP